MAAVPVSSISIPVPGSFCKRRPLKLTSRRLEANRRNAAHSSGPRTPKGKARVARNAIKHGFFVSPERWTERQHREFAQTFEGLCDDFRPQTEREEVCVATIADSFVRMADLLRYENLAALKYHQQCEREFEERIANADADKAARLRAHRDKLRSAGLWHPTLPAPREAIAILRYEGRLHRMICAAVTELSSLQKLQKQTHFVQANTAFSRFAAAKGNAKSNASGSRDAVSSDGRVVASKVQKQTHFIEENPALLGNREVPSRSEGPRSDVRAGEIAKTKPLSPMFIGNRHERRRAAAMARRRT